MAAEGLCAGISKMCTERGDSLRSACCACPTGGSRNRDSNRPSFCTRVNRRVSRFGNSIARAFGCPWTGPECQATLGACMTSVLEFPGKCFRRARDFEWPKWEPDQKGLLVKIVNPSKLDGFKSALKPGLHCLLRAFYALFYTACFALGAYLMYSSYLKIIQYPIIYKYTGRVSVNNTPVPATTFCPSHMFIQSMIDEARRLYEEALNNDIVRDSDGHEWNLEKLTRLNLYLDQQCKAGRMSFSKEIGLKKRKSKRIEFRDIIFKANVKSDKVYTDEILPFVRRGQLTCKQMIAACRLGHVDCTDLVEEIETSVGICCSINNMPTDLLKTSSIRKEFDETILDPKTKALRKAWLAYDPEKHDFVGGGQRIHADGVDDVPWRQKYVGRSNGLSVLLRYRTKDMACPINDGDAFMVEVHDPLDEPRPLENGIPIPPKHEGFINVNADVTLADKDVQNLPREDRRCELQRENFLEQHTRYTEGNCKTECLGSFIQMNCSCRQIFTPAWQNGKNVSICGPNESECVERVIGEIEKQGFDIMCLKLDKPMKCYPPCTDTGYRRDVSIIPITSTFDNLGDFGLNEDDEFGIYHVYFGSDNTVARERHQQYDLWEIVGIFGGILGLTNGMDFMSIAYIIAAVGMLVGAWWLMWKNRKAIPNWKTNIVSTLNPTCGSTVNGGRFCDVEAMLIEVNFNINSTFT